MIADTITPRAAQRYYDRLGKRHDLAEAYEGRAKARALELLHPERGQRALNVGVGTGKTHVRLAEMVEPGGLAAAVDLSPVMLRLTRARTGSPVCGADARRLPFADGSFNLLLCCYVLDLIPSEDLPGVLAEFHRVLVPSGRAALVSLTEATTPASRVVIGGWKALFRLNPILVGGCRPVEIVPFAERAGFRLASREVSVQLGVPSEITLAVRS